MFDDMEAIRFTSVGYISFRFSNKTATSYQIHGSGRLTSQIVLLNDLKKCSR
jgi:hypothetical protein